MMVPRRAANCKRRRKYPRKLNKSLHPAHRAADPLGGEDLAPHATARVRHRAWWLYGDVAVHCSCTAVRADAPDRRAYVYECRRSGGAGPHRGLLKLGWTEDRNAEIHSRWPKAGEEARKYAADLVAL